MPIVGATYRWSTNLSTPNAIWAGSQNNQNLYVCRATYSGRQAHISKHIGKHIGKLVGSSCHLGYADSEKVVNTGVEVLVLQ